MVAFIFLFGMNNPHRTAASAAVKQSDKRILFGTVLFGIVPHIGTDGQRGTHFQMARPLRDNSAGIRHALYAETAGTSHAGTFLRRTAGYAENANAVAEKVIETQCGHPEISIQTHAFERLCHSLLREQQRNGFAVNLCRIARLRVAAQLFRLRDTTP